MATVAPSRARRRAVAAPMPREPPWMKATLPARGLAVRLFQRSTRKLALTTDGERLYGQVRLPWREISDALTDLRQGAGKPAGTLKVALAHTVGREYVLPLLGEFVRRYPD